MVEMRKSIEDAIRQLDADFMKAANAKDAASLVNAFYAEDAVLMPPNHPIVEGRSNIQGFFQGLIDSGFSGIEVDSYSIESSGALAYSKGRYNLTITPPDGTAIEDVGKYVVCYRRQDDGSWRVVADIFNSDKAA